MSDYLLCIEVKDGASRRDVFAEFKKLGIKERERRGFKTEKAAWKFIDENVPYMKKDLIVTEYF